MKKKLFAIVTTIGIIGSVGVVYAAAAQTPAEIVSGLTGKAVDVLYAERADGKTFGTIASDAGKLEEFKEQMLEQKKEILDQRVEENVLTQEEADEVYNMIQENQTICDGTGNAGIGRNTGAGFGNGSGKGIGNGQGYGMRNGGGSGFGGCGLNR